MSYFYNLLMFLEKTETSLRLKLPPQEQRAKQCKRCQATMFILSLQVISECTGADDTMCFEYSFRQGVCEDTPIFSWY